jgi:hypothetical protein
MALVQKRTDPDLQEILLLSDSDYRQSLRNAPTGNISVVQNTSAPTGNVSAAQNTNAQARNVSAVQNAGAPTVNVSSAQNTNAPTRTVSAVQNTGARTGNVSSVQDTKATAGNPLAAHPANALTARSDRPPEVRASSARDASSMLVEDSPVFATDEGSLVAEPWNEPSRRATELRWLMCIARSWLARLVSSPSIRFLTIFCIGVTVTLAWQSYRDAGTEAITSWCGRWVPQAASTPQNVSSHPEDLVPVSPDLLKTTSLNLAGVRESIDKVAAELSRLETIEKIAAELTRLQVVERATPDRTLAVSPLVPPIPPAGRPPSPSRPSPGH